MNDIITTHQLAVVAPLLVLTMGALLILLFDVFSQGRVRHEILSATALIVAFALYALSGAFQDSAQMFSDQLFADPFSRFFALVLLGGALGALILGVNSLHDAGVEAPAEYHALLLFSLVGAIVFVSAAQFISLFIGLEIMSMALYALCASAPGRARASESGLKYFLLGSFSSAFLLYGIALLYGLTGTMVLAEVAVKLAGIDSYLPTIALGFIAIGLLFKVGAVPFHAWMPDVYQGAPTPVTAFMASAVKAAAFAAALRVFSGIYGDYAPLWSGMMAFVAAATMVTGNILALQQRSMKRMLAYSSIAHAGYLLVGILALGKNGGTAAILFYLVVYSLMTFGSLAIVHIISSASSAQKSGDDISRFQGLGAANPFLAVLMSLFLFALAGLPPGVSGLVGKIFLFGAAIRADYVGLTIIGVLSSVISCYYYLRVIVAMYFMDEVADSRSATAVYAIPLPLYAALLICAALIVLLGLFPATLFDLTVAASQHVL